MFNPNLFARLESQKDYVHTRQTEVLNPHVNFHGHTNTQTLTDMMVAEAIQMRGVELYYIPREFVSPDLVFGEDVMSKFTKAWKFAAYFNSYEGFEGAGNFFDKFGYSATDEVTISINPGLFKHQVNGKEPQAGDLLYFPMDNSLWEINWIQPNDPLYQAGRNAIRKIVAEKFTYSGEEINPELQYNEGINIPEFSELDLAPVSNLDGLADIAIDEYAEDKAFNEEAREYVEPFDVINGRGSPFADF